MESGSFPFRYQTRGSGTPGGRTQGTSDVSAEIARPFAELRWTGALPGTSRAKAEVEEPADFSRVRTRESPGGEALTAVYLSHRVSAGPITARARCLTGVLGEGIRFLR